MVLFLKRIKVTTNFSVSLQGARSVNYQLFTVILKGDRTGT